MKELFRFCSNFLHTKVYFLQAIFDEIFLLLEKYRYPEIEF